MPQKPKGGITPRTSPAEIPGDSVLLDELLDHLDTVSVLLDLAQEALSEGAQEVKISPRSKPVPVAVVVDRVALDLVQTSLQVRAQRALREGAPDEKMNAVLDDFGS